jgi:hypothetical protein
MPRINAAVISVALAGFTAALPSQAANPHDYPTVDRVEFVLECLQHNAGRQEYLYRCACVIDEIAARFAYDDFVEASTAARYQTLGGDRGGVFRDAPNAKAAAKRYLQVRGEAMQHCSVPQ